MKLLVFQHVAHEHPGLISDFAKENNISLEIIELWKPYKIPSVLQYDGLIIMGGPMSVYDRKDGFLSKDDELNAITSGLGKMPMLEFCLGWQLLVFALGAKIHPNAIDGKQIKEVGFYKINLTNAGIGHPLFNVFKTAFDVLE